MKKLALIAAAAMTIVAVGCQETLQESLEMTSSEKSVAVEGETSPLSFTASSAWTITSDADWVTFDRTEGEAGDVTVTMNVAANDEYESRTAKVTITMGAKSNVITITQAGRAEFAIETVYNISAEAQTIDFAIESNIEYTYEISEDTDWIEIVPESKAAPTSSTLSFSVKENPVSQPREGHVYIEAGDAIYNLVVTQAGGVEKLAAAEVTYLGNTMKIYDNGFTSFKEYLIVLTSEDGNTTVNLAVNAVDQEDYLAGVPAGSYTVDVTGVHADNTFSLKPADGSERYYTAIIKDGVESEVLDGTIDIVNTNGTYAITAMLYDANGTVSTFSYTGTIDTIEDASFAAAGGATFENNYNTYYATGANIWNLYFYVSKSPAEGVPYMDYICFDIAGESGTLSGDELPTGTFTLAVPTTITSGHPQGNLNAEPGSLIDDMVSSNDDAVIEGYNGNKCKFMEGSTVTISKNEDGTYNFVFDATIDRIDPTSESSLGTFEYEATFSNVNMPISKSTLVPVPDGDAELTTGNFMGYQGYYLGNKWGVEGCHAFIIYLVSVNNAYTMYLPVYIKGDYTFEANYSGIGCSNPLPEGTCTWSETPGENTLLPVVYSANGTSASYRYNGSNSYTGTGFRLSGGSVTVKASEITFDLDVTTTEDTPNTYHFTGTVPISVQFMQNHSSVASRYYTLNEWQNRDQQ